MTPIETLACIAGVVLVILVPLWMTERSLGRLPRPTAARTDCGRIVITWCDGPPAWTPFSAPEEL